MAATPSAMVRLGTAAPDFALPDIDGTIVRRRDYDGAPALLVMFICNHCPFVKHIAGELARIGREYRQRGVAVVAISANDAESYPDDSPEMMLEEARVRGYTFPYLYDETQKVAKAFQAACTPDFFVYDAKGKLYYRGQLDDSRPGNEVRVTGGDLRSALEAALAGRPAPAEQKPSMGCNIKWKAAARR